MYRDPEEMATQQDTEAVATSEVAALPEAETTTTTTADEFQAAAGTNVAEWGAAQEEFEPADSQF